jgi:CheY-like chemotaxis protein
VQNVLVIDDDEDYLEYLVVLLTRGGYSAHALRHGRKLAETLRAQPFHAVITDLYMPDVDGIEVLLTIRQLAPALPVIGITGSSDPSNRAMVALGANAVLSKPVDAADLLAALQQALADDSPGDGHAVAPAGRE